MNILKNSILIAMLIVTQSCGKKSMANQQTLYTNDCGNTWEIIEAGKTIPLCHVNCQCSYDISLPNYPMQGNADFKFAFKGNVLAAIEISYDYEIVEPLLFIKEAKYLGKANTSQSTEVSSDSNSKFESAENSVIDIRIREVTRDILEDQDVVDFSPSEVEDIIFNKVNNLLKDRGVRINSLSLVTKFDEQTKLAIDVATASKVYKTKGLDSIGNLIMTAKAGANSIIVKD